MNRIEYAAYKERVEAFFTREEIIDINGKGDTFFSKHRCDCCNEPLAGDRETAMGVAPGTGDAYKYEVCKNCVYFAACGKLDDQAMEDIKNEPVPLITLGGEPVRYDLVPVAYMAEGVRNYIEGGQIPGSFLLALVSNDLFGAYRTADQQNLHAMRQWIDWFYNHSPAGCSGSKENVEAWCNFRKGEIE